MEALQVFVKLKRTETIYCCFFLTLYRESLKEPFMFPHFSLSFQSKGVHLTFNYAYIGLCSEFLDVVLRCHLSWTFIVLKQFRSHFGILKYVNYISLYIESVECLPWLFSHPLSLVCCSRFETSFDHLCLNLSHWPFWPPKISLLCFFLYTTLLLGMYNTIIRHVLISHDSLIFQWVP